MVDTMDRKTKVNIDHLKTESRNPKTLNLDTMTTMELIRIMNEEDQNVINTIKEALPQIEKSIRLVIEALDQKGRLIYMGAGTSGRLGILDAVECVPTFSTTNEVTGIIAGGDKAFVRAVEGAEDSEELAASDLEAIKIGEEDVVVAIAASGRTPYAIGALKYAKKCNSKCISISCNKGAKLSEYADEAIEVDAGPEILTGSTRLKAGTCQKIILNMISTAAMVGIGKVYGNLMVDMKATNLKLIERAKRIVMESTGCDLGTAAKTLEETEVSIKEAIVMILTGVDQVEAKKRLADNKGFIRKCI
ncbi:N-acetylmuramic acid 6-phosphate etherase [Anaerocolumna sp. MB42-C2]|uniref:N-acetylmuramic acid 6-phosphate etherase n=1 Tax=Anaerocolumna sp. MB42-C2 TaxID=3070997 RepID=UPI0027DFCDA0|nr:N-acetylmuramic acid 6-phosphate etherase [Anaerocolumna sp. MB42-C2]WMJ87063.1 N-acetylmuramic acid 6-phosphate etherase [Anaerocolumna sp. MB42-C2]